ncbi:MAG: hypothetical protein GX039_00530 [Clostridia bacterium]|nr:hypothetical protein [Clostridia bacterium]
MINRIEDPDRTARPAETPQPASVPHPRTSPLEFPPEAEPGGRIPLQGIFYLLILSRCLLLQGSGVAGQKSNLLL